MSSDPTPAAPARDPDWLVKWVGSVLVVGVLVGLLTNWLYDNGRTGLALIPVSLLVVVLLVTVPRTGLLRPERQGGTRWTIAVAGLLLLAYLGTALYAGTRQWSTGSTLASLTFLWAACVLLTWHTLTRKRSLAAAALGVAVLLLGVAVLLFGVADLRGGVTLVGVGALWFGVGSLLWGVVVLRDGDALLLVAAGLLLGIACLLVGFAVLRAAGSPSGGGSLVFGAAFLLVGAASLWFGIAGLLLGFAFLSAGDATRGAGGLLLGATFLLVGAASLWSGGHALRDAAILAGITVLLVGAASLWSGGHDLRDPDTLVRFSSLLAGAGLLLFGVAFLLFGVATLRDVAAMVPAADLDDPDTLFGGRESNTLLGVAALLSGVALLLLGVAFLRAGDALLVVACLLLGFAFLPGGFAFLRGDRGIDTSSWGRWWTQRPRARQNPQPDEAPIPDPPAEQHP